MIYIPNIKPWLSEAISEPAKKAPFHIGFWAMGALARISNEMPRKMSPISITKTGR